MSEVGGGLGRETGGGPSDEQRSRLEQAVRLNADLMAIVESLNGRVLQLQEQHGKALFQLKMLKGSQGKGPQFDSEVDKRLAEGVRALQEGRAGHEDTMRKLRQLHSGS